MGLESEEHCRYVLKTSKAMKDEEKRFNFVRNQINSLEESLDEGPEKRATIKTLATWAIKEFTLIENFKHDKRMLDVWMLMGKYSENMGMEGVMENLHRLGLFRTCPEFYLKWAEHWCTKGNRENVNKTMRFCEDNCRLNSYEAKELFKPLLVQYFDAESSLDGKTMDLIKMLAARPEDVRPELTIFNREHERTRTTTITSFPRNEQNQATTAQTAVQEEKALECRRQPRESITEAANREEFSVFKDPTNVLQPMTAIQFEQPMPPQQQQQQVRKEPVQSKVLEQSRVATLVQVQPEKQPIAENAVANKNKAQLDSQGGRRNSFYPELNDVTLAGSHGKNSSIMLTSTPRRSINPCAFEPVLEGISPAHQEQRFFDDLEASMMVAPAMPAEKGGGKEALAHGGGGGSKLQKRLSLLANDAPTRVEQPKPQVKKTVKNTPNELVRTLPHLKIGSTIEEVSEDKENTSGVNSAFSSPFRKKTKVDNDSELQMQQQQPAKEEEPKELISEGKQVEKPPSMRSADDDLNESTHTGLVIEKIKPGTVNPWDEQMRQQVLAATPLMVECHEFPTEKSPRIDLNRTIWLGGEQFHVDKLLGQGGFARVYKAKSLDNSQHLAIKYEAPACPWEVYICFSLRQRLRPELLQCVMQIRDAYIFANASAIVYEYYPHGTLLDLGNLYKKNAAEMGGLMATYFGIQLGRILEQVHAANIIHGDVKPDNVVLTACWLDERKSLEQLLSEPNTLKLIDWGRSIDMAQFEPGQEFVGRAGTEHFDCVEMISGLPWTFQTDFYGFVASVYVLLRGEYLITFKYCDKIVPTKVLKRRMALYDLWQALFDRFLNIPSCKELPKWTEVNRWMEERLKGAVATEMGLEWRKAVERFNAFMKQASG